jgi:hypothetical protein
MAVVKRLLGHAHQNRRGDKLRWPARRVLGQERDRQKEEDNHGDRISTHVWLLEFFWTSRNDIAPSAAVPGMDIEVLDLIVSSFVQRRVFP